MTVMVVGRGRFATDLLSHLRSTTVATEVRLVNLASGQAGSPRDPFATDFAPLPDDFVKDIPSLLGPEGRAHLHETFAQWEPSVVVIATSLYSPYVPGTKGGPFGATLPQQLPIAWNLALAAQENKTAAVLLNACYPEMVNPILHALGSPVHAGLGNAQTMNQGQTFARKASVHALAHHAHLGSKFKREPLLYDLEETCLVEPTASDALMLSTRRALRREDRNRLGAVAAAEYVRDLALRQQSTTCLPGVHGETGAVPVAIDIDGQDPTITMSDNDLAVVRARHQQECVAEGWAIDGDGLRLSAETRALVTPACPIDRQLQSEDIMDWLTPLREAK